MSRGFLKTNFKLNGDVKAILANSLATLHNNVSIVTRARWLKFSPLKAHNGSVAFKPIKRRLLFRLQTNRSIQTKVWIRATIS